jgi:hypothetical protein
LSPCNIEDNRSAIYDAGAFGYRSETLVLMAAVSQGATDMGWNLQCENFDTVTPNPSVSYVVFTATLVGGIN